LERPEHIIDRKLTSNTNCKRSKPTLLEKLEPRILLSGDNLLHAAAPDLPQDALINSTPEAIQHVKLTETEEQLPTPEQETHRELDPSDTLETDIREPVFTLFADGDDNINIGNEAIDKTAGDLKGGNIGPAQPSDDLAVLSDDSAGNIDSRIVVIEMVVG